MMKLIGKLLFHLVVALLYLAFMLPAYVIRLIGAILEGIGELVYHAGSAIWYKDSSELTEWKRAFKRSLRDLRTTNYFHI